MLGNRRRRSLRKSLALLGPYSQGRFRFPTAIAAGAMPSPYTEPNAADSLTLVDASGLLGTSPDALAFVGTPAAISNVYGTTIIPRAAGRAFLLTNPSRAVVASVGSWRFGLGTSPTDANLDIGLDANGNSQGFRPKTGNAALPAFLSGPTPTQFAFVMRGTGGFDLYRAGVSGAWTLAWVYNTGTADLYAKSFMNLAVAQNFSLTNWRVADLGGAFATDYGLATDRKATSAANDTIAMAVDAIVEYTVTAATGVTQELMVRRTDDNNCCIVRMDQAGSTIRVYERIAGVETPVGASTAQTWTNGTQYRVVLIIAGNVVTPVVANVGKTAGTLAGNTSATGVKVSRAGADLVSWPRSVSIAEAA